MKAESLMARLAGRETLGVNSSQPSSAGQDGHSTAELLLSVRMELEGMEMAPHANGLLPFLSSVSFHPERLFRPHTEQLINCQVSSRPAAVDGAVRYEA
jgi:hypothetical protein